MRYSNLVLTDYNVDGEIEVLIDYLETIDGDGTLYEFVDYLEELKGEFKKQINNGVEEWLNVEKITDSVQKGQLAYEFANGFIIKVTENPHPLRWGMNGTYHP